MGWRTGAEPFVSEPVPDAPWPVAARNILTDRETELYQRLMALYPDDKIFVQVALSQLIDVDRHHPESESIRARYKQLVADFVLCRADLSLVCVIELDDRSHERADRKQADARKNKVLADAGIRLVRIPAGLLPSTESLRRLVDAEPVSRESPREETVLRLADTVLTYADDERPAARRSDAMADAPAFKHFVSKIFLAVVLLGGLLIFSRVVPFVFQRALQPLAVPHVIVPTVQPAPVRAMAPPKIVAIAAAVPPPADTLAEEKRAQAQAAAALQRQKNLAWEAFYAAPTSCEHPVDWNAQVECGNQYMRAKKRFEVRWAAEQNSAAVVPDNGSMGGGR